MTDTTCCEIIVTGPPDKDFADLCSGLVTERLAACVNLADHAVRSTYWWQGELEHATEARAFIHTRRDLIDQVTAYLRERHPYDVPNITALPIIDGNPEYLAWIVAETSARQAPEPQNG